MNLRSIRLRAGGILSCVLAFFAGGCGTSDFDPSDYYVSYGVVHLTGEEYRYEIVRDDGVVLRVWENSSNVGASQLEEARRVRIQYNVMGVEQDASGKASVYRIRLIGFYDLLVKDVQPKSGLTPEEEATLGDDPVGLRSVTGGNGYLNLEGELLVVGNFMQRHKLSLVWDDETFDDGKIRLALCHRAEGGSTGNVTGKSLFAVSFRMPDLPDAGDEVPVSLTWQDFGSIGGTTDGKLEFVWIPAEGTLR